jgi:hypothetical protein
MIVGEQRQNSLLNEPKMELLFCASGGGRQALSESIVVGSASIPSIITTVIEYSYQ